MITRFRSFAVTSAAALTTTLTASAADLTCAGDVTGDGSVGFDDVVAVLADWGPCPGCASDLTHDDLVAFDDLLTVLSKWDTCVFDYGPPRENSEAEQIALELLGPSGTLLIPDVMYERVVRDLEAIRAAYPELVSVSHTLAWAPAQLIVAKLDGQPTDDYDAFNAYMDVVSDENFAFNYFLVTYPANLNVAALAGQYADFPNVQFAEPNGLFGGQNFWDRTVLLNGTWRWTIDDGFHDCFDGCDCHRYWTIDVAIDGTVTLVNYEEIGLPWCDFSGGT